MFAEEVRKLAEQLQEAAKHIASLISEIQTETDSAVIITLLMEITLLIDEICHMV
ncbi:hypothetical protein [Sporomusa rhizae]|uniref:hypothetical protein n=1 Tax=Sporomusa rhizae TaxID=357999 RepID=UPI00352B1FFC